MGALVVGYKEEVCVLLDCDRNMRKDLRLAVISDVHIGNWLSYSRLDKWGRPDRLTKYLTLADDFSRFSEKKRVDAVVIAGDLLEAAVSRPQVLMIARSFLERVAKVAPIFLIHGQHDIDTKESSLSSHNSVLSVITKEIPGLHYFADPTLFEFQGWSFWFQPWNQWTRLIGEKPADIFVGHGLVSGSKNHHGYIFRSGFHVSKLMERFPLSIVGDLHNGSVYRENNRAVLIPGTPLQNSWSDAPNCGFWSVVLSDGAEHKFTFAPIHEIRPDFYHRFLYTDDVEKDASSDLVHLVARGFSTKKKKKRSTALEKKFRPIDPVSEVVALANEAKRPRIDHLSTLVSDYLSRFDLEKEGGRPEAIVERVKARNFLSIRSMEFDLTRFERECVVIGKNGSGKTTIPEAIYWCLTGRTTKDVKVKDIQNRNSGDSHSVTVDLVVNSVPYRVERGRSKSSPFLRLFVREGDEWLRYCGGSVKQTDEELSRLLCVSREEMLLFTYFSTIHAVTYGDLTDSGRNDLIARLFGFNVVESLRSAAWEDRKKLKTSLDEERGRLFQLRQELEQTEDEIGRRGENAKDDIHRRLKEKKEELRQRTLALSSLPSSSSLMITHENLCSQLSTQTLQMKMVQEERAVLKRRLGKVHLESRCFTCEQPLPDSSNLSSSLAESLWQKSQKLARMGEEKEKTERKLSAMDGEVKAATAREERRSNLQGKILSLEKDVSFLNRRLRDEGEDSALGYLQDKLSTLRSDIESGERKAEQIRLDYENLDWLVSKAFSRSGLLMNRLNRNGVDVLQKVVNELLFDQPLSVRFLSDFSLSVRFQGHRSFLPYALLSSGQKRIVDLSLMIALNSIVSDRFGLTNGVLGLSVFDEVVSLLDEEFVEVAKALLSRLVSLRTLVITHDERLLSFFNSFIHCSMDSGSSHYEFSLSG